MLLSQLQELIEWIKANPNAAELFASAISFSFTSLGGALGWFLHGLKYKRDKRLEAKTDIYPQIHQELELLQEHLNKNNRLNITSIDEGNIYTLQYLISDRRIYCKAYNAIDSSELKEYRCDAEQLNKSLSETNNSIHPKAFMKKKWQDSKKTIVGFCKFLLKIDDSYTGDFGFQYRPNEKDPIHIVDCKKLINAINYILKVTK